MNAGRLCFAAAVAAVAAVAVLRHGGDEAPAPVVVDTAPGDGSSGERGSSRAPEPAAGPEVDEAPQAAEAPPAAEARGRDIAAPSSLQPRGPSVPDPAADSPAVADAPIVPDPWEETTEKVPALPGLVGLDVPPRQVFTQTALELAGEPIDPAWSADAEAVLLGELSRLPGLNANLLHVQCRTTMCGVVIVHPAPRHPFGGNGTLVEDFAALVEPHGLAPRIVLTNVDGNGALFTALYLHRDDGSTLRSVPVAVAAR